MGTKGFFRNISGKTYFTVTITFTGSFLGEPPRYIQEVLMCLASPRLRLGIEHFNGWTSERERTACVSGRLTPPGRIRMLIAKTAIYDT